MQTFRFIFDSYGAFSWLFILGCLFGGMMFANACWAFKNAQILQLRRERFRLRQELALRSKSTANKPASAPAPVAPTPQTALPAPTPVSSVPQTALPPVTATPESPAPKPVPPARLAGPSAAPRRVNPVPDQRPTANPVATRGSTRPSSLREDRQLGLVFYLAPEQPDALERLDSITPALVKDLNMLGIYKFEQIARWNEVNVRSFALLLGMDPAELERLDWVRQAKLLHGETHGSKMILAA